MSSVLPTIRSYRLEPTAFWPVTKRRIWRQLAVVLPSVALFGTVWGVAMGTLGALPIALPIVAVALAFGVFRAFRVQQKKGKPAWDSYALTISDNVIRRQVANLPTMEILRPEVTRIIEARGAGLTVATSDGQRFVYIPEELVGFEEVRRSLAQWKEFEPAKLARSRMLSIAWPTVLMAAWIGTGVIRDIRLAMVAGALLVVLVAVSIRAVRASAVLDNRTKAAAIGAMSFMLFAPVGRLILYFWREMYFGVVP